MKERILQLLHALCVFPKEGAEEEMRQLKQATGLAESAIRQGAGDLLDEILNDYSGFSVGTIDKFFQSVIRAFTHEIGIQPGYNMRSIA